MFGIIRYNLGINYHLSSEAAPPIEIPINIQEDKSELSTSKQIEAKNPDFNRAKLMFEKLSDQSSDETLTPKIKNNDSQ